MVQMAERRQSVRVKKELALTLSRAKGGPVSARTIDIGSGGMRIASGRPLRVDELLDLALPLDDGATAVSGTVRVMREEPLNVYGLRFEQLAAGAVDRLAQLTA